MFNQPCKSKRLWVVDSVGLLLCVGKDQGWNPYCLLFCVCQRVHVDVGLHVVQLQTEVVPGHVQAKLVAEYLADLIDVKNLDQVDGDENPDLEKDALLVDSEWSIVWDIVPWLDHQ